MATTSARVLRLLSLLEARATWRGADLATRLSVSPRTLRRDIDTLRELGYPVEAIKGPDGGYRLGSGGQLPPLLLDDDQAIAIALALQTAPATVTGIDDAVARALTTLRQIMPARIQAEADAFRVTALRNYWDFAAPPIDLDTLRAVGHGIRTNTTLRFDYRDADGRVPEPGDPHFTPPAEVEPHQLVVWAGRWYLIARAPASPSGAGWRTYRVDRIRHRRYHGHGFCPTPLTADDITRLVVANPDRGDTGTYWQVAGTATLALPGDVVARWAPGGSVVETLDARRCRLTIGGWSWAGIAGLFATFDAPISDAAPEELRTAFRELAERSRAAAVGCAGVA